MDKKELIKKIQKIVKKKLKGESSGHGYWHCYRVVQNALFIGKKEKADLKILELSAWLHDISIKKGRKNHEIRSAKQAEKILTKLKIPPELIAKVVKCIKNHRFSTGKAETLEEKILQDADKLDVMGAIGIARIFAFAGRYKRKFHDGKIKSDTSAYKKTGYSRTIIEHFYDKIFLLPKLLHTKSAQKMGRERIRFARQFVKRFLQEWKGKKYKRRYVKKR